MLLVSARTPREIAEFRSAQVTKPPDLRCNVAVVLGPKDQRQDGGAAHSEWRLLDALFEDAPAAVAVVRGPDHVHEQCNPLYCRLVGRPSSELLGRPARKGVPELAAQGLLAGLDHVRASGEPFVAKAVPARFDPHADGVIEDCYFSWVLKPARGDSERILIFASDVTEQVRDRERAEALAAAEAKGRAEIELAHVRLEGLNALALALSAAVTQDDVTELVVEQGMRHARADIATLYALNDDGLELELLAHRGVAPEVLSKILRITKTEGNPRVLETLDTSESIWAENEQEYAAIFPAVARTTASGPRAKAFWSVPLVVEGRPVGLLGMGFYSEQRFSPDDRRFVETFAKLCAQALLRAIRRDRELVARGWLATTLQSIGDAVIATDNDGRVTFMNGVAERLTGWTEAEAHGRDLTEVFAIFSELTREAVESPVAKVLREGTVVGLANHTLLRAKNGAEIPIDDSGAPIKDNRGEVYGVVLVFRDVTAEKRAEKRRAFLARAMETLVSSLDYRETLKRVAELAVPELADWVTVDLLEPESTLTRQVAVAHVDPEKVRFAREIGQQYPPNRNEDNGTMRVMRTGKSELYPEIPSALVEAAARDANHLRILRELKLESAMVVALRSEGGRTLGAMTFVYADSGRRYSADDLSFAEDFARRAVMAIENARAVSEVEAARTRERSMREQAELANTAKDHFLATVSHELRTPLNVILGWSVVLREREAPPDFQRALGVIERNARAQARLIEDVLDVSRIISGKLALALRAVNVGEAVRAAVDGMRPAADAKGIRLDASDVSDERTMTITADADRLQQILWNLLANAVKFTPKDGAITVSAERVGSEVCIQVSDTGEGIRAGVLPYVFEAFRQADSSTTRRHGGLGLGLSLVKQIAAAHGGTAHASSPGEGRGATFVVRLPARAATEAVIRPSQSGEVPSLTPARRGGRLDGLSVLVVDDELDARDLVSATFQGAGAIVHQAASASEALGQIEAHHPAILVSDIGMPHEDGYALLRKIRALPAERGGRIPALALTAYARPDDAARALEAGYQRHVCKPVDPFELVEVVAELAGFPAPPTR
jgi:PAS domain S-box-containing protein